LHTAKLLATNPKDCVVIEDSPFGVIAAKQAGMKAIGVIADETIRVKLQEAGADVVIESLREIL